MRARRFLVACGLSGALAAPALAEKPDLPKRLPFDYQVAMSGYIMCGVAQLETFGARTDVAPSVVLRRALDDCRGFRRDLLAVIRKHVPDAGFIDFMMKPADEAFRRGVLKGVADERALRDKTRRLPSAHPPC